jgi:hypothetical protein
MLVSAVLVALQTHFSFLIPSLLMFAKIRNVLGSSKPASRTGGPIFMEAPAGPAPRLAQDDKKQVFTKVFRYRLPDGQAAEPSSVEVVGSFSHWQRVPLVRDGKLDSWHAIVHHIPGNRTHHYMLLIDGKAAYDKTCDGMVAPHGLQEERYQLATERGPRVLLLFAQTK